MNKHSPDRTQGLLRLAREFGEPSDMQSAEALVRYMNDLPEDDALVNVMRLFGLLSKIMVIAPQRFLDAVREHEGAMRSARDKELEDIRTRIANLPAEHSKKWAAMLGSDQMVSILQASITKAVDAQSQVVAAQDRRLSKIYDSLSILAEDLRDQVLSRVWAHEGEILWRRLTVVLSVVSVAAVVLSGWVAWDTSTRARATPAEQISHGLRALKIHSRVEQHPHSTYFTLGSDEYPVRVLRQSKDEILIAIGEEPSEQR